MNIIKFKKLLFLMLIILCSFYTNIYSSEPISLTDVWNAYISCPLKENVKNYVDEGYVEVFYNAVPPKSELVKLVNPKSEEYFGNYARLFIEIKGLTYWIAFIKSPDKKWKITNNERELLKEITKGWHTQRVGKFVYHSIEPLSSNAIIEAQELNRKAEELELIFGEKIENIDYFYSLEGEEAINLGCDPFKGAGKALPKAIKAVETANHQHELVHVYRMEIGITNSFIDEGLATAFGNDNLIISRKDSLEIIDYLNHGYEHYLSDSLFRLENGNGKNIYGLAQVVTKYWINKFGFKKIRILIQKSQYDLENISDYIEMELEKSNITNRELLKLFKVSVKD